MQPIAYIETPFNEKFGIPRQSGIAPVQGRIVFYPDYRSLEAVRGLDSYDYIWLVWRFDSDGLWHPTVRPPRLGGNQRMGVFATRSPFRPNPIGLSSVKLLMVATDEADSPVLYVEGADLRNHTEIFDIKPYIPYADSHPDARCELADGPDDRLLNVVFNNGVTLPDAIREQVQSFLAHDPRPRYHDDPSRVYGLSFAGYNIKFSVSDNQLTVISASQD